MVDTVLGDFGNKNLPILCANLGKKTIILFLKIMHAISERKL